MLTKKAWSPYLAGIVIGLLQIPAFLLIETALGASSSYVTVGGMIHLVDRPFDPEDRLRRPPRRRNWQELVAGRARSRRRYRRFRLDEAFRRETSTDLADLAARARLISASKTLCGRFRGRLPPAARRAYRGWLHQRSWPVRHGAIGGRLHGRGRCHVRRRYHHRDAAVAPDLRGDQSCQ